LEATQAYDCSRIFAVKGNHDVNANFAEPITDLHLCVRDYGGVIFGGLNGSWRYKPHGHFLYDQGQVRGFLNAFLPVHVFLLHNSPRAIHDQEDGVHYGFETLNAYIHRAKPKVVIHGHQHVERESLVGQTRIIGVHGHRVIEI
jgi:Icc-related predicted phosphoesterase